MTHREIGMIMFAAGAFIGLMVITRWIVAQVDKAHHRAAKRELHDTLSGLPVFEERIWPEGGAEEHFLGTDWYDPTADADAFIERMRANTQADIAQMRADTEAMMARPLFDDADTITIDIGGRQDE
jgi:hypothetical protein